MTLYNDLISPVRDIAFTAVIAGSIIMPPTAATPKKNYVAEINTGDYMKNKGQTLKSTDISFKVYESKSLENKECFLGMFASEELLKGIWLSDEEDEAWKDL